MNSLPPTILDRRTLDLLGRCLAVETGPEADQALRLALFSQDFSWNNLVAFASEHEVLVPLIHALRERRLLLPVPRQSNATAVVEHPTAVLDEVYRQHLMRQDDLRSQLHEITTALNQADIMPLVLKGARYLLPDAPAWAEARTMRDIDLLIHPEEAMCAQEVLSGLGYESLPELSMSDHHLPPMLRKGCFGSIELHTKALAQDARDVLSTDHVWDLSVEGRLGDARLRTMPHAWQALIGILHHQVSSRGYKRRLLALKGLWEFAREARDVCQSDWQTVACHVEAQGARAVLAEWLVLAESLFGLTVPGAVTVSEADRRHAAATARWASRHKVIRGALFSADVLRFAFSRKRLAMRYGREPRGFMIGTRLKHLFFLINRHSRLQLGRFMSRQ